MKYVVVRFRSQETPIIFPNHFVHSQMAEALKRVMMEMSIAVMSSRHPDIPVSDLVAAGDKIKEEIEVVSAGECLVQTICSGGSETLQVKSRGKEDSSMINMYDYLHGL